MFPLMRSWQGFH